MESSDSVDTWRCRTAWTIIHAPKTTKTMPPPTLMRGSHPVRVTAMTPPIPAPMAVAATSPVVAPPRTDAHGRRVAKEIVSSCVLSPNSRRAMRPSAAPNATRPSMEAAQTRRKTSSFGLPIFGHRWSDSSPTFFAVSEVTSLGYEPRVLVSRSCGNGMPRMASQQSFLCWLYTSWSRNQSSPRTVAQPREDGSGAELGVGERVQQDQFQVHVVHVQVVRGQQPQVLSAVRVDVRLCEVRDARRSDGRRVANPGDLRVCVLGGDVRINTRCGVRLIPRMEQLGRSNAVPDQARTNGLAAASEETAVRLSRKEDLSDGQGDKGIHNHDDDDEDHKGSQ